MARFAQIPVPTVPKSKPIEKSSEKEFSALKRHLDEIASWDLSPDSWDKIQIIYTTKGGEKEAECLISSVSE